MEKTRAQGDERLSESLFKTGLVRGRRGGHQASLIRSCVQKIEGWEDQDRSCGGWILGNVVSARVDQLSLGQPLHYSYK